MATTESRNVTASPGQRLRELLTAPEILVVPGAYDAISARLVQANGFDAVYVTGGGTTNAHLGLPDIGVTTLTEMATIVTRIADAVTLPVFSDADTGYGTALNVMRTVREFERGGLAGLHIEDQSGVKRCGHLDGKSLISAAEMSAKVQAACEARRDPGFVVIARTDAVAVEGMDGALERAHAYAEAGADVLFIEALRTPEEFADFAQRAPDVPLLANMTEYGRTDLLTAAEFQELGYAAVIFPMTAFRLMLRAVDDGLRELAVAGTQRGLLDRMRTRDELYELVDYARFHELERRFEPNP
jgi:methylisocitrate lyase